MNPIRLSRSIVVRTFDAQGTIAVARSRPEWLAVAQLAKDLGGEITPEQIATELLGNLPEQVGKRVMDRCVAMGLLTREKGDESAGISELGQESLREGRVFVPEERLWRVYYVDDPLVSCPLLHVEPLEPGNAARDRKQSRETRSGWGQLYNWGQPYKEGIQSCPFGLLKMRGQIIPQAGKGAAPFILQSIAQKGHLRRGGKLQLRLNSDGAGEPPNLSLEGELDRPNSEVGPPKIPVSLQLALPDEIAFEHESVWQVLAAHGGGLEHDAVAAYCQRVGRLVLPQDFAQCPEEARHNFRRRLEIPEVPTYLLPELGAFDASAFDDVEVIPSTDQDAQKWAEWLLWDSIDQYMVEQDLVVAAEKVTSRFEFHQVHLPSSKDLLARALRMPTEPVAKRILAPFDLGLWNP